MTRNSGLEEKDLLDSYERGEWKPVKNIEAWRARLQSIAATALESSTPRARSQVSSTTTPAD